MTHDEWFAFVETLTGMKGDPASFSPRCFRDLQATGHELSLGPNPFDVIASLESDVSRLTQELAEARPSAQTVEDIRSDVQGPARATRTKRSA